MNRRKQQLDDLVEVFQNFRLSDLIYLQAQVDRLVNEKQRDKAEQFSPGDSVTVFNQGEEVFTGDLIEVTGDRARIHSHVSDSPWNTPLANVETHAKKENHKNPDEIDLFGDIGKDNDTTDLFGGIQ